MTKESLNVALVAINTTNWKGEDLDAVYLAKLEIKDAIKKLEVPEVVVEGKKK